MCSGELANCDVCGNPIASQPQAQGGFGQAPSGFGQAQGGFGQAPAQGGFGQAQAQGGFGQPAPAQGGFGQAPAQGGFGQPAPAPAQGGFGQPAGFGGQPQAQNQGGFGQANDGFGGPPNVETSGFEASAGGFPTAPSFDAVPKQGFNGTPSDTARFAETVATQSGADDSVYWAFKSSLMFSLKCLIPVYGIILMIMCAIGNPRKYPTQITNYLRASLITSSILMLLSVILTLALGAGLLG